MFQHFKLKHADHTDDDLLKADARPLEGLDRAFLAQLQNALDELLALETVDAAHASEELRREHRNARIAALFARAERIAQRENAGVEQADDVARIGVFNGFALIRHELLRLLELNHLVRAAVPDGHALGEHARTDAHEGQSVAVRRVHVGLNLEDETGEIRIVGLHQPHVALMRGGRGGVLKEAGQERLDAEVGDGRTEEHRRQLALAHKIQIERIARDIQQLDFVHQALVQPVAEQLRQLRVVKRHILLFHARFAVVAGFIQLHHLCVAVVNALEVAVRADGPVDRAGANAEHLLHFLHQGERVFARAVHLVDKGENWDVAQAADLEQLDGLRLDALGRVDEHHGAVRRDEHAIGVLREVLVAGGVENVDVIAVKFKLHGRGGHGNAALFLDIHPVAGGMFVALAGFDGTGGANRARIQQQLFGQRRFAGVRVGDNGKRPAAGGFSRERTGHRRIRHG